jgi:hypothetical protein
MRSLRRRQLDRHGRGPNLAERRENWGANVTKQGCFFCSLILNGEWFVLASGGGYKDDMNVQYKIL